MANLSNINNKFLVTTGGNVLIGKTAANNATVGTQIMSTGDINPTVSGDTVARFNRLSNDGEIIRFQQDTLTDGAINSLSGRIAIGSGTTGIFFDSIRDVVTPHNMTTNAYSANISLGRSAIPFKDLYLSGSSVFIDGAAYSSAASIRQQSSALIFSGGSNGYYFNKSDNSVTHVFINSSGNVGIGTVLPGDKLEIKSGYIRMYDPSSNINAGYPIRWSSNNGGTNVTFANISGITTSAGNRTGDLYFSTSNGGAPTQKMRIDSGGSIIIGAGATSGTPTADYRSLEIGRQGNTITGAPWKSNLYFSTNATITSGSTTFTARYLNELPMLYIMEDGIFTWSSASLPSSVGDAITFSEKMRITSSGLTIFKSSFVAATAYGGELNIGGSSVTTFGLQAKYNQSGATQSTLYSSPGYTSNDQLFLLGAGAGNTAQLVLKGNGNVGIGDTAPTSISVNTSSLSVNSSRNDLSGGLISKANGTVKHQQYWDSSGYSFNLSASSGVFKFNGAEVQVNANIKANDIDGKLYSMVASWSYVASKNDLFSYPGTEGAVWEYTIKMNPNTAGSGAYRDYYYGKLGIGIGWNGSNVTQYIWQQQDQTAPRSLYTSGGGNFNPLFRMYYSGGVYTELAINTAWTLRIQGLSTTTYGDIFFRRLA